MLYCFGLRVECQGSWQNTYSPLGACSCRFHARLSEGAGTAPLAQGELNDFVSVMAGALSKDSLQGPPVHVMVAGNDAIIMSHQVWHCVLPEQNLALSMLHQLRLSCPDPVQPYHGPAVIMLWRVSLRSPIIVAGGGDCKTVWGGGRTLARPGTQHDAGERPAVAALSVSYGAGTHRWPQVYCWHPSAMQSAQVSSLKVLLSGPSFAAGH